MKEPGHNTAMPCLPMWAELQIRCDCYWYTLRSTAEHRQLHELVCVSERARALLTLQGCCALSTHRALLGGHNEHGLDVDAAQVGQAHEQQAHHVDHRREGSASRHLDSRAAGRRGREHCAGSMGSRPCTVNATMKGAPCEHLGRWQFPAPDGVLSTADRGSIQTWQLGSKPAAHLPLLVVQRAHHQCKGEGHHKADAIVLHQGRGGAGIQLLQGEESAWRTQSSEVPHVTDVPGIRLCTTPLLNLHFYTPTRHTS